VRRAGSDAYPLPSARLERATATFPATGAQASGRWSRGPESLSRPGRSLACGLAGPAGPRFPRSFTAVARCR
jgi:hypothetical protein